MIYANLTLLLDKFCLCSNNFIFVVDFGTYNLFIHWHASILGLLFLLSTFVMEVYIRLFHLTVVGFYNFVLLDVSI